MDTNIQISARQAQILKAIIEEYLQTAEPVGSETLEKKYSLGVSPATIRNEMVRLADAGLLRQLHTSGGRSPTPLALKFYVEQLMKPKDMSVADEVAVKERIWDYRQEMDKLLREATKALAERSKALAITATNDGYLYYAGVANVLDMPEFYDFELTHSLFQALEEFDYWWSLLEAHTNPFDILLGEQMGQRAHLGNCGFIYAKFDAPQLSGAIGVVGPSRLNYPTVIPVVRYLGGLIDDFARSW